LQTQKEEMGQIADQEGRNKSKGQEGKLTKSQTKNEGIIQMTGEEEVRY
jgi:hypothetical protein